MKKIHWATFSTTEVETSSNRIDIQGDPKPDLEVRVVDKEDNEISRYVDVKQDQHKILIVMKFQ